MNNSNKYNVEVIPLNRGLLGSITKPECAEIIERFISIGQTFTSQSKNYVYKVRLGFGDRLIENGRLSTDSFQIGRNEFGKNISDLINDLNYSNDPLGFITKNHLEAYTKITSADRKLGSYTILLKRIKNGEFLGLFGTLNYLSKIRTLNRFKQDWHVVSGNVCFNILFPFHNGEEKQLLEDSFLSRNIIEWKSVFSNGENTAEFLKKYIPDWESEVLFFPKHYIDKLQKDSTHKELQLLLFNEGWKQQMTSQNALLEDTSLSDIISIKRQSGMVHKPFFLNLAYRYIVDSSRSKAPLLIPLKNSFEHPVCMAIDSFKKQNLEYFNRQKSAEPLPFIYDKLDESQTWGILSLNYLPVLYNYELQNSPQFVKDLRMIYSVIPNELKSEYKLPDFRVFGNPGKTEKKAIEVLPMFIEEFLLKAYAQNFSFNSSVSKDRMKNKIKISCNVFTKLLLINKAD